jgi:pimeloyl-ACP methyl ester carboxylesterase
MRHAGLISAVVALLAVSGPAGAADREVFQVRSKDGAPIEVECTGSGPELLIVHGGTGDRTRWTPMFPLLQQDFTVCAMDRRAHGRSGDRLPYSLAKEAQDVVAVVEARHGHVAVLGHSFGGVVAYEAAFLTPRITSLVLYEPPVRADPRVAALAKMDAFVRAGDREAATEIFMRDIVLVSPDEINAMRARPSWKGLVGSIEGSIRQHRALAANPWDPARAKTLRAPTLLLIGSRTGSQDLRRSVESLAETLPNARVVVLEGQEHNAMDTDRDRLATVIRSFALQAH